IPSGIAALLVATSPFWVYGIERSIKVDERAGRIAIAGMIIGFVGLAILVVPDLGKSGISFYYFLGLFITQIACASWSAGSVYAKHYPVKVAPLMSAAIQMIYAGLALTLVGTLVGEWPRFYFNTNSATALVYLIIFGSIVAFGAYSYAIQKLPLSLVSMYAYINPVIAVLLGWLILKEAVGWRVVLATATILAGVGLVKLSPSRKIKQAEDVEDVEVCPASP
ncbi:MAG: EamA family transporter, partial [Pyrinomonadaceae bacterium]